MAYTTIDKPTDYFNTKLTTGTGSSQAVTGVGFQPDWIWGKRRDSSGNNSLFDSVRGITKGLESNNTGVEFTSTDYYSSFDSDGFTIASGAGGAGNGSGQTAVQWCWKAGGTASSNTDGSITSSVSANTTAGFSIVSYTGTGSASTIGHGLNSVPKVIIIKNRSNARNWQSYHESLGNQAYLRLNTTGAASTGASIWNNTSPTSSVFSIGTSSFDAVNASGDNYIAYCFAEKKGYSKFGSYTGNNNADGTFVYAGFKPGFVLIKNTNGDNWVMFDNKREGYNPDNDFLQPNSSNAEATEAGAKIDLLSNGFKLRGSGGGIGQTNNANLFIYMAFAEHPFVSSTGTPVTAR